MLKILKKINIEKYLGVIMKLIDIFEKSISTKSSVISKASKNRTIGFELEIAYKGDLSPINSGGSRNTTYDRIEEIVRENYSINDFFREYYLTDSKNSFSGYFEEIADFQYAPKYKVAELIKDVNPEYFRKSLEFIERYENIDMDLIDDKKKLFSDMFSYFTSEIKDTIKNNELSEEKMDNIIRNKIKELKDLTLYDKNKDEKIKEYVLLDDSGEDDGKVAYPIESVDFDDIDYIVENPMYVINMITDHYDEFIREEVESRYEEYDDDEDEKVNYNDIEHIINDELGVDVRTGGKSPIRGSDYWVIDSDESVSNGFELISPVFENIDEGIKQLENALDMISNNSNMYTNESTGLHINIGNINLNNFDLLKFLVFIGEQNILKEFNRSNNKYTLSLLDYLYRKLSNYDMKDKKSFSEIIYELNTIVRSFAKDKFRFISIRKLFSNNNMEIRGLGGNDYEKKKATVINFVRQIAHRIDIAEDPDAYRNEYLKKIYEVIKTSQETKTIQEIEAVKPLSEEQTKELVNFYILNGLNKEKITKNNIQSISQDRNMLLSELLELQNLNSKIPSNIIKIFFELYRYGRKSRDVNLREDIVDDVYKNAKNKNNTNIINFMEKIVYPDLRKEQGNNEE